MRLVLRYEHLPGDSALVRVIKQDDALRGVRELASYANLSSTDGKNVLWYVYSYHHPDFFVSGIHRNLFVRGDNPELDEHAFSCHRKLLTEIAAVVARFNGRKNVMPTSSPSGELY